MRFLRFIVVATMFVSFISMYSSSVEFKYVTDKVVSDAVSNGGKAMSNVFNTGDVDVQNLWSSLSNPSGPLMVALHTQAK